jgi:branched-subunit amino acid aminotransferase/4-amino-4-deoxychorismate lyase
LSANDPWNTHKTTRYFAHAEARRRAVTRGFDEALFLNEFGNVVEASAHNLFWIKDACLFSPPSDAGGLPGTFAAYVRRIATDLGIRHLTANAWIGEVRTADTLFLTNAVGEIRKVSILVDLTIALLEDSDVGRLVLERVEADRDLRADSDLTFHI